MAIDDRSNNERSKNKEIIHEFDRVRLKDGREGTILDVYTDPDGYEIELDEKYVDDTDWVVISIKCSDISEITYHCK